MRVLFQEVVTADNLADYKDRLGKVAEARTGCIFTECGDETLTLTFPDTRRAAVWLPMLGEPVWGDVIGDTIRLDDGGAIHRGEDE